MEFYQLLMVVVVIIRMMMNVFAGFVVVRSKMVILTATGCHAQCNLVWILNELFKPKKKKKKTKEVIGIMAKLNYGIVSD